MKCVSCNAPVVQTVDDSYVCVECGQSPIQTTVVSSIDVAVGSDDRATDDETVRHRVS